MSKKKSKGQAGAFSLQKRPAGPRPLFGSDQRLISAALKAFLEDSLAKCTLLIDRDGHPITGIGDVSSYDMDTISALAAGAFAATQELARQIGEPAFGLVHHEGKKDHLLLSLVGERTLLAIIFDDHTTLGMVRYRGISLVKKLAEILARPISAEEEKTVVDDGKFKTTR